MKRNSIRRFQWTFKSNADSKEFGSCLQRQAHKFMIFTIKIWYNGYTFFFSSVLVPFHLWTEKVPKMQCIWAFHITTNIKLSKKKKWNRCSEHSMQFLFFFKKEPSISFWSTEITSGQDIYPKGTGDISLILVNILYIAQYCAMQGTALSGRIEFYPWNGGLPTSSSLSPLSRCISNMCKCRHVQQCMKLRAKQSTFVILSFPKVLTSLLASVLPAKAGQRLKRSSFLTLHSRICRVLLEWYLVE